MISLSKWSALKYHSRDAPAHQLEQFWVSSATAPETDSWVGTRTQTLHLLSILCYLTCSESRAPAKHCDMKQRNSIWHTWTAPLNIYKHERIWHFPLFIKTAPWDPVDPERNRDIVRLKDFILSSFCYSFHFFPLNKYPGKNRTACITI